MSKRGRYSTSITLRVGLNMYLLFSDTSILIFNGKAFCWGRLFEDPPVPKIESKLFFLLKVKLFRIHPTKITDLFPCTFTIAPFFLNLSFTSFSVYIGWRCTAHDSLHRNNSQNVDPFLGGRAEPKERRAVETFARGAQCFSCGVRSVLSHATRRRGLRGDGMVVC